MHHTGLKMAAEARRRVDRKRRRNLTGKTRSGRLRRVQPDGILPENPPHCTVEACNTLSAKLALVLRNRCVSALCELRKWRELAAMEGGEAGWGEQGKN